MKRQRPKLINETRRTHQYNTRSSSRHESRHAKVDTPRVTRKKIPDPLPTDLIMEILKRLPVKTLARFLCVSTHWASIIRSPHFNKLFLAESSTRPGRLFFTFKREKEGSIFSLLQTENHAAFIATYNLKANDVLTTSSSLHGLVCYPTSLGLVVYNSTTGRTITLPEFEQGSFVIKHFLGYDSVDGVYKVLCLTGPTPVYRVLTLGNENLWRVMEHKCSYVPMFSHICINGVVYYDLFTHKEKETAFMSFDVRSEKFDLVKGPGGGDYCLPPGFFTTMIRYEGKLAMTSTEISADGSMVLWVLEDVVKRKWLKKVFVLPSLWTQLIQPSYASSIAHELHCFVGVNGAGELLLAPLLLRGSSYYVLYYDPKRNSMRKVVIEGMEEHNDQMLLRKDGRPCFLFYVFSSHVESLMFL